MIPEKSVNKGGRPIGSKNKSTTAISQLRDECASLWGRTKAFNRLAAIAEKSDEGLFKVLEIMAKLLPRNVIEATGPVQIMIVNPTIDNPDSMRVADALRAEGHEGPITPQQAMEKIHALTMKRLNGSAIVGTNGKAKTNGSSNGAKTNEV